MLNEIDRPLHEFIPPPEPVKGKKSHKKILPALLVAVLLTCITATVDRSEYIEPPPIINGDHGISARFAAFSSAAEIVVDIEEPERMAELSCKIIDRHRNNFLLDEGLEPDKKQLATGEFRSSPPLWKYVEAIEEAFGSLDDEGARHLEVIVEVRFRGESVKWPVATAPLLFAYHDVWPHFENDQLVIELWSHGPLEGVTTDLSKVTKTVVGLQIDGILSHLI